jgi:hypothetical protein
MQHLPTLEVAQLAVRSKICTKCYQRPIGSETLGASVPRSCESRCTVFLGLGELLVAVRKAPADASPDQIMKKFVCPTCQVSASGGDFCAQGEMRSCPLSRYGGEVLQILEDLRHRYQHHQYEPT